MGFPRAVFVFLRTLYPKNKAFVTGDCDEMLHFPNLGDTAVHHESMVPARLVFKVMYQCRTGCAGCVTKGGSFELVCFPRLARRDMVICSDEQTIVCHHPHSRLARRDIVIYSDEQKIACTHPRSFPHGPDGIFDLETLADRDHLQSCRQHLQGRRQESQDRGVSDNAISSFPEPSCVFIVGGNYAGMWPLWFGRREPVVSQFSDARLWRS